VSVVGIAARSAAPWVTDLNGLPSNAGADATQKLSIGSDSSRTSTPRAPEAFEMRRRFQAGATSSPVR